MRQQFLLFVVVVAALAVAGCETTTDSYNPFKIDQEKFYATTKTIALAPIVVQANVEASEQKKDKFESHIENKLREAGFSVVPSKEYGDIWKRMSEQTGGYFDPVTGNRDEAKFKSIQERTFQELERKFNVNAILYSSILIVKASFNNYVAEWDGTEESFDARHGFIQFLDTSMSSGTIGALSMQALIKDIDGATLYVNRGGIQVVAKYINGFVPIPKGELLLNEERNVGAVNIALTPFISKSKPTEAPQSQ